MWDFLYNPFSDDPSFHMTPHMDWFDTYQLCDGTVYMGDTSTCKIFGVGGVKFKCLMARFIQFQMYDMCQI